LLEQEVWMFKRDDHAVVHRFATACRAGNARAIRSLLAPEVMSVSDGGGQVTAALSPVRGVDQVARSVADLLGRQQEPALTVEAVNGQPGVVVRSVDGVVAVMSFRVTGGKVAAVWIVLNPDKLRHWG
jgi:RNA polymerase sigma-70 factor (ECF subfamily)